MPLPPRLSAALDRLDREELPTALPAELPLLTRYRRQLGTPGAFRNADVLLVQHHLAPLVPRLAAMAAEGLEPDRSWLADIPYSTNDEARDALRAAGVPSSQTTTPFTDPLVDYCAAQEGRVAELVERLGERRLVTPSIRPLLVVDDGAYFLRALRTLRRDRPDLMPAFRGARVVEQTTRGHRYIHDHARSLVRALGLSVVSVARCRTKIGFESHFIGAAVSRAVTRAVGSDRLAAARRIAVIGYGAVGRATVRRLLDAVPDAAIDVVDRSWLARRRARRAGPRCRGLSALDPGGGYDLVVGCTGYASFRLEQRRLLADGAALASGSSAAIEFNRAGFVDLADRHHDDPIEVLDRDATSRAGIRATIELAHEGGRFSFLNAGFPVNFDGRPEHLPVAAIQPTHCLLYAAAEQALHRSRRGVQRIDRRRDEWIGREAIGFLS